MRPWFEAPGAVAGIVIWTDDMTEHTSAPVGSPEESVLLNAVLTSAPVGICVLDTELRFILINERLAEINGVSSAAHIGKTVREIVPSLEAQARRVVEQVASTGKPVIGREFSGETPKAPGLVRHWSESWYPVHRADGTLLGVAAVIEEITESKQAQEILRDTIAQLTATFDNAAVGIATCGPDGRWRRVNDRLCAIVGWPREELVGRYFGDITHPDDLAEDLACGRRLFAGDIPNYVMEKRYLRKDGSLVWVNLTVGLVRKPDSAPDYFVSVVEDISLRKHLEDERSRYVAALRDADRRKDEFLAMLAHELRNPLAPIFNAIQIARALGPVDARMQQTLDIIGRQVTHLTRLVDDLLDVSRVTSGKISLTKAPVDLADVISAGVELTRPLIDAKRQVLDLRLLQPGELCMVGDATRLTQVVGNLLNNAAKYTETGGHIEIQIAREANDALVTVKDNGIGIEAELLPRVFDLFSQAERSLDRAQGGLGIGLSLVRTLVELHGGSVAASSAGRGRGSLFTVRLPLAGSPPQRTPMRRANPAEAGNTPRRILVVDDNVDSAESLRLLLELSGHQVSAAHDAATALARVAAFQPEVCLLDIGLPGMDGFELARRLRATLQAGTATYFALTGYGQEEDRKRAQEAGFAQLLVKPVEPGVLLALINALPAAADARR
jgi:PAS domain S-box-containing protein